jgi:hypothetical protein
MGVLSAVVTFCVQASDDIAPFFRKHKTYMSKKYAPVAGLLIGVHRELMEKRLGQKMGKSLDVLAKQFRSVAYFSFKQKFNTLPPTELDRVCRNFEKQIKAGEWDVFRLADEYFISLVPYDSDFHEANKVVWSMIKKMRVD